MEEHGYGFYEEPCEFDDLWGTKEVADALTIPVAGGEQEFSLHRLAVGDRQPRRGHRPARPALRRRLHPGDPGGPHGGGGRADRGAAHVRRRAWLPGRGPLRVVHAQHRPVHGVQGQRDAAGVVSDVVARGENGMVRCPAGSGSA